MNKVYASFKTLFVTLLLIVVSAFMLTGCTFGEMLSDMLDVELLKEQNEQLLNENESLKQELATLKFKVEFPDSIIDEDVELNRVNLKVEDNTNGDCLQVVGNAQVTINGGNYDGGQTPLGGAGNTALWVNSQDAKVIINGGNFTINGLSEGDTGHIDLIYCSQGTIEINGGYFEGADNSVWLVNCKDTNYKNGTANIIVKGGTFKNFDPSDCISEGEHTNFVPDGYVVVSEIFNEGQDDQYTLYTVMVI